MRCGICANVVRKTTLCFTAVEGKMSRTRCCARCVRKEGFTFIIPSQVPTPKPSTEETRVVRAERVLLKTLETWLTGQIKAYVSKGPPQHDEARAHVEGLIEAYESVLERIKRGV